MDANEDHHMSPETANEVVKINTKMITSLLAIGMALVGGIAWGVRLEYRTETNAQELVKASIAMDIVRQDARIDHDKVTRHDTQMIDILRGIDEIKGLLKDKR